MAFVEARAESLGGIGWAKLATATSALVVACDADSVDEIAQRVMAGGRARETPVALVAHTATPSQRVSVARLDEIGASATSLEAPHARLLLCIDDLASHRDALTWFDRRPLFGKRVLVTRARAQAGSAAAILRERGAEPVVLPTIEIGATGDPRPLEHAVARLAGDARDGRSAYDWVAFTSSNGVEHTWREVLRQGLDARAFGRAKIAAIGPGTASSLELHGLRADVVAKEFRGEGLATEMLRALGELGAGVRVLLARAKHARDVLPDALRAAGCHVDVVPAYETRPVARERAAELLDLLAAGRIDAVTFTSSSTVDSLCELLGARAGELLRPLRVASIGPITTKAAEGRGVRVDVTAHEFTVLGLIDALEASFRR